MQAFHTSFGVAIESRLHFLLIRDELVSALCWSQRDASLSDPLPALSRARTVDTIKGHPASRRPGKLRLLVGRVRG